MSAMVSASGATMRDRHRLTQFRSCKQGEVVATLSRLIAPHEMLLRDPRQRIDAAIRFLPLSFGAVAEIRYGATVQINSWVPSDHYMLHMVTDGESLFETADGSVANLRQGMIHLSLPSAPLRIEFGRDSRHLTASLNVAALHPGRMARADSLAGLAEQDRVQAWRRLLELMLDWAGMGAEQWASSAPRFEGLISDFFAGSCHERQCAEPATHALPSSPALPWYVARARRSIAMQVQSSCESIALPGLAASIGVSPRTLQHGFQRSLGHSFLEELRLQRLAELDRRLGAALPGAEVTAIMQACGIVSMGRFAGYYRERYGILPSERLRRTTDFSLS